MFSTSDAAAALETLISKAVKLLSSSIQLPPSSEASSEDQALPTDNFDATLTPSPLDDVIEMIATSVKEALLLFVDFNRNFYFDFKFNVSLDDLPEDDLWEARFDITVFEICYENKC